MNQDQMAIAYNFAESGSRLFPQTEGKTPPKGFTRWKTRATTDPKTLCKWAGDYPRCNWAEVCGPKADLWVILTDTRAARTDLLPGKS